MFGLNTGIDDFSIDSYRIDLYDYKCNCSLMVVNCYNSWWNYSRRSSTFLLGHVIKVSKFYMASSKF